jgi:hypothetical protein
MFFQDNGANFFKWALGTASDGTTDMMLDTLGLRLGDGIGAVTEDVRLLVKGRTNTTVLHSRFTDSNNLDLLTLSNQGVFKLESTRALDRDHYIGSTSANNYTQLNFSTDNGAIGAIGVAGSTASYGGNALWTDSMAIRTNPSCSRLVIGDRSSQGFYITHGGMENATTYAKSTSTGFILGSGIGGTAIGARLHVVGSTLLDGNLGVFGATPIAQPTTAIIAPAVVGGGGTTITDTDTFEGYTLSQIVKALRSLGALA